MALDFRCFPRCLGGRAARDLESFSQDASARSLSARSFSCFLVFPHRTRLPFPTVADLSACPSPAKPLPARQSPAWLERHPSSFPSIASSCSAGRSRGFARCHS
uniref:(northern house mosquito) hypothetical protein n=1 Tax=Culex pipiens TaxID=7175 RepID=A0A8D8HHI4_CULPI